MASTRDIDICNLALAYLGNTRSITSMAEQSTEAILCSRFFTLSRQSLLKQYPWTFAVFIDDLTLTTDTDDRYDYVYEYPLDCLRILAIQQEEDDGSTVNDYNLRNNWDVASELMLKRIATNVENAVIRYIFDAQDYDAMPTEFIDALALSLAARLAMPLTSSGPMAQGIAQQSISAIEYARRLSAMEKREPIIKENKYITSRG